MITARRIGFTIALFVAAAGLAVALGPADDQAGAYDVRATAELGTVKVLANRIQFGEDGTLFDYVTQGGQEILFPFTRATVEITLAERHDFVFLYQPLTVESQTRVPSDLGGPVQIDEVSFAPGTAIDLKYGFDFWRASYLYRVVDSRGWDVGVGLSLQLRNASIVFQSTDGEQISVNQNLGPVPILKTRAEYRFPSGAFLGTEIDGFYASSAFFNGADFDFEGSILDASLRAGVAIHSAADAFLNVRFLGGTAKGTSQYDDRFWTETVNRYTENVLSTLSVTIGARLR